MRGLVAFDAGSRLGRAGVVALCIACQPVAEAAATGKEAPGMTVTREQRDQGAQEHRFRLNPSPKQGYEITLEVRDAPGDFADVRWSGHYQTSGCSYVTSAWAGTRAQPTTRLDLAFKPVGPMTWKATVFLDALLDEDYYGNGVCQWQLLSVTANLVPSGQAGQIGFSMRMDAEALTQGKTVTRYFRRALYGQQERELSRYSSTGVADPAELRREFRHDLFTAVLAARRVP